MIYGDFLNESYINKTNINTKEINDSINIFNEECYNINNILKSLNILSESNMIIEADFSKVKTKLKSVKDRFIQIIKNIIDAISRFIKEKIIGGIKKLKNIVLSKLSNIDKDKITNDVLEKLDDNGKDCQQKLLSIKSSNNNINEEVKDYKQIVTIEFNNSISNTIDKVKLLVDDFISQVRKIENSTEDNKIVNNIMKIAHNGIGEEYYIDYTVKNMGRLESIKPRRYETMFNEYEKAVSSFNKLKDSLSDIISLYENEQEDILPYIAIGAKEIVKVINDDLRICTTIYSYLVKNLSILSPGFLK